MSATMIVTLHCWNMAAGRAPRSSEGSRRGQGLCLARGRFTGGPIFSGENTRGPLPIGDVSTSLHSGCAGGHPRQRNIMMHARGLGQPAVPEGGLMASQQHAVPLPVTPRKGLGLMLSATGASLLPACAPTSNPSGAPASSKPTTAPAVVGTAPASGGASAPTPAPAAASKTGETPKRGGVLRWGQVGDIVTTDAVLSSPASNETTGNIC